MARIYCWVLEREVEVNDDCKMRFGRGDGTMGGVSMEEQQGVPA